MKLLYKHSRKLIVLYIILTFIKFFTANIYHVREEDPTIYFKFYPSLENKFLPCPEQGQLKDYYDNKYFWYKNNQYWEIFHSPGGMQNIIEILYDVIIAMWWILSTVLILFGLYSLFMLKHKNI